MNTYSRALRHIDMKDVKQKHQQKIIEEKIKRQKIEEEKKYIQSVMKSEKYDWRKELNEGMTSANTFFTTLPATGDTTLETPAWNATSGYNYSISGGTLILSGNPDPYEGNEATVFFDTSKYDTLVFDVQNNGILNVDSGPPSFTSYIASSTSSGTFSIQVPPSKNFRLIFYTDGAGAVSISNLRFQRRSPMNVFVPLNSPEATSFIRTEPSLSNLSPQERLQKLKEMLEASDEYVMKILGSNFPGTGAVPPGEYDPFAQTPPGEAGDTPGVDIASLPPGPSGYKAPGTYDPKQFYNYSPPGVQPGQKPAGEFIPSPNLPMTGPGLSQADQDTQIAQLKPIKNPTTPGDLEWNKYIEDLKKGKDPTPSPIFPTKLPLA